MQDENKLPAEKGGTEIMKKKALLFALCFMCVGLIACGTENTEDSGKTQTGASTSAASEQTSKPTEAAAAQDETSQQDETEAETAETVEISAETAETSVGQSESSSEAITEYQALDAIKNYCFINNPTLKNMVDSAEYNISWNVIQNDADEIVVLYRSYTGAQIRYYISPVSGETYVTELVPGIIDEEQRTDESFNVRDYLV
jgi:hypothetical protein